MSKDVLDSPKRRRSHGRGTGRTLTSMQTRVMDSELKDGGIKTSNLNRGCQDVHVHQRMPHQQEPPEPLKLRETNAAVTSSLRHQVRLVMSASIFRT